MSTTPAPDQPQGTADAYAVESVQLRPMLAPGLEPPESLFGARLKYARDELKLNIEGLARLTKEFDAQGQGISPTSISRYETAGNLPGLREFRILCDALDVPPQWLLYGHVSNAEGGAHEQALVKALREFVRAQANEDLIQQGDAQTKWFASQVRRERLARARKP